MCLRLTKKQRGILLVLACAGVLIPSGWAASCKTESQMTPAEREALSSAARNIAGEVQSGDLQGLRTNTIPAVAADFTGIAASADALKAMVQKATITVNNLYALDASTEPAGTPRTDFYCGTPVVVLNFTDLPPGSYALVILHATGVPQPQQISLILSKSAANRWMLAGFYGKPMMEAGHDGLWYWASARRFAQKNGNWAAWFYYRTAANLLSPVEFLSSSNLDKLRREEDHVRPDNLPGPKPVTLNAQGSAYQVTAIDITTELGPLDLDVHYLPNVTQVAQLHDPPSARKQVVDVMAALLALHPDLHDSFHGFWVHADQGEASIFSLELPMDQIPAISSASSNSGAR